jgi:hypothetical protein
MSPINQAEKSRDVKAGTRIVERKISNKGIP